MGDAIMGWRSRRFTVVPQHVPAGARPVGRPPAFLALDLEAVLPTQWFAGDRPSLEPAKRLMLAILTDAIELVLQDPAPPTSRRAFFQRRAADWLRSDDRRWFFSCVNICEMLGMDVKRLRAGIAQLVAQRLPDPKIHLRSGRRD
jgi:hypothetical protein